MNTGKDSNCLKPEKSVKVMPILAEGVLRKYGLYYPELILPQVLQAHHNKFKLLPKLTENVIILIKIFYIYIYFYI